MSPCNKVHDAPVSTRAVTRTPLNVKCMDVHPSNKVHDAPVSTRVVTRTPLNVKCMDVHPSNSVAAVTCFLAGVEGVDVRGQLLNGNHGKDVQDAQTLFLNSPPASPGWGKVVWALALAPARLAISADSSS